MGGPDPVGVAFPLSPRLGAALPRIRPRKAGKGFGFVLQLRARKPKGSAPGVPRILVSSSI
jgi:hypothetical protein